MKKREGMMLVLAAAAVCFAVLMAGGFLVALPDVPGTGVARAREGVSGQGSPADGREGGRPDTVSLAAGEEHLVGGEYFELVDGEGRVLWRTGRRLKIGEQYLTAENDLYEITSVDGLTARARFVEKVTLPSDRLSLRALRRSEGGTPGVPGDLAGRSFQGRVGIYHTHNAESYVPTDGTDSINGRGGIHEVGRAMKKTLEGEGVEVIWDQTLHLPHDAGAYRRSRSTVVRLLGRDPDALFDIHRDAAPPEQYAAEVAGIPVTQVQLVVGTENQNFDINRQYALSLKRISDLVHPGLVRGIFFSAADFNQDLSPLNILLEVGAHTNSRIKAENGIRLFAQAVNFYFYGPEEETSPKAAERGVPGAATVSWRTVLSLVLLVGLGGMGFLVLNSRTPQEALERVRSWVEPGAWRDRVRSFRRWSEPDAWRRRGQAVQQWAGRAIGRSGEVWRKSRDGLRNWLASAVRLPYLEGCRWLQGRLRARLPVTRRDEEGENP